MPSTSDPLSGAAVDFCRGCSQKRGEDNLYLPDWSLDDWKLLFANAALVSLGKGDALMRRGDPDRALYFVVDGALELSTAAARGGALGDLVRVHPGSVIGEISFFDGQGRSATVWATRPTHLLRLGLEGFRAFANERPQRALELLFALGGIIAFRLRRSDARRDQWPY